jgi:hypothetical protein
VGKIINQRVVQSAYVLGLYLTERILSVEHSNVENGHKLFLCGKKRSIERLGNLGKGG